MLDPRNGWLVSRVVVAIHNLAGRLFRGWEGAVSTLICLFQEANKGISVEHNKRGRYPSDKTSDEYLPQPNFYSVVGAGRSQSSLTGE